MKVSSQVAAATAKATYAYGKFVGATKPRAVAAGRYTGNLFTSEIDYRTSLPGIIDRVLVPREMMKAATVGRIAAMVAADLLSRRGRSVELAAVASAAAAKSTRSRGKHRPAA